MYHGQVAGTQGNYLLDASLLPWPSKRRLNMGAPGEGCIGHRCFEQTLAAANFFRSPPLHNAPPRCGVESYLHSRKRLCSPVRNRLPYARTNVVTREGSSIVSFSVIQLVHIGKQPKRQSIKHLSCAWEHMQC